MILEPFFGNAISTPYNPITLINGAASRGAMMYTTLDVDTWTRRAAFQFFSTFEDPTFNVTVEVDVSSLVARARGDAHPFSVHLLHAVMHVANACEPFRLRHVDGEVRLYEVVHPTWTTLAGGGDALRVVGCDYAPELTTFAAGALAADRAAATQETFLPEGARGPDRVHFSMTPWLSFTSVRHARQGGPTAGEPKIMAGRYQARGDRLVMPLSVEGHHALMDGVHVAELVERLQARLQGGSA